MAKYNLQSYADISQLLQDDNYAKTKGVKVKKQGDLYILKYNKQFLQKDNLNTLGLFRSIITDGNKLIAFSPPKSISSELFTSQYSHEDAVIEEFVEGTMINYFYHDNKWMMATRWNIGANTRYYQDYNQTFKEMFDSAVLAKSVPLDTLDKTKSYSFVLQHPNNRIVVPFTEPNLVLVGVYELNGWMVQEVGRDIDMCMPRIYTDFSSWENIQRAFASPNTDYIIMGVIIKHSSGMRSKFRNPMYEKVRKLKGNSPKIQFQYYNLYQLGRVKEYLTYYPEHKGVFWNYRNELFAWTDELWKMYHEYYVQKNISIDDVSYPLRPHIRQLHYIYLSELREKKQYISKNIVINYICQLHPAKLMYAINYPLRQKKKDDVKGIQNCSSNVV